MFESGNIHPGKLLLRIIELPKIGDIKYIYTTTYTTYVEQFKEECVYIKCLTVSKFSFYQGKEGN